MNVQTKKKPSLTVKPLPANEAEKVTGGIVGLPPPQSEY